MGFELNEDGSLRWIDKTHKVNDKQVLESAEEIYEVNFYGLYACNITTNIAGESIKIERKDSVSYLDLDKITSIELSTLTIRVNTTDELSYYFTFVNEAEALEGFTKIEDAVAGDTLACTASQITVPFVISQYDPLYPFTQIKYPSAIFIDDLPPIEVLSKTDMIAKLNALSPEFSVSNHSNMWTINFTYVPYKVEYVPKKIKILPRHIKMQVWGTELFLKMDLFNTPYYLFSDNELVTPIDYLYDLKVDTTHTVRVYFISNICNYFEVGKAFLINFQHNIPTINLPANAPLITKFVSTYSQLQNLPEIWANSTTTLKEVSMENNSWQIPTFAPYQIHTLEIVNSFITTLVLPVTLQGLLIKNMSIATISGNFPNLVTLKVENCGLLTSIVLSFSPLREVILTGNPISSITLSSTFDKMYQLTLTDTTLTSLSFNPTILKSLNQINISANPLFDIDSLTNFMSLLVSNNKSQGGYLNVTTDAFEIRGNIDDSFGELKRKGWTVVF